MNQPTITSTQNEGLKQLRKLAQPKHRAAEQLFVAEGEDLVAAAAQSGWEPVALYSATDSGLPGQLVEPELLASCSTLASGTRTIGVYEQRWAEPQGPLCVYLHGVGDPGNVGTILRSAQAFGVATVVLGPDCADSYGPKAVRASMGAVFGVALARAAVEELPGEKVALVAHDGELLRGPASGETTLLVGAERTGLPQEVVSAADRVAQIPIESESLNAAMAATVALYELNRIESS